MLRLVLARTFHFAHPSYPLNRLFSNTTAPLMAAESTGTHRDPVTGEAISKQYVLNPINILPSSHRSILYRELKRRQKQREKEARRAENTANQPPAPANAADGVANEDDLSPNVRWSW